MPLTLEIGSGHNPHPRSDILVDKYLAESRERESKRLVADRPLVIASGERLPFRSGAFDYVMARHVLEHATDPAKFLDEIQRVGRAGYIETPSPVTESLLNWPYHRWFVSVQNGVLHFRRKEDEDVRFGNFFRLLVSSHLSVRIFRRLYQDKLYTRLEWSRTLPYVIDSKKTTSTRDFVERMEEIDKESEVPLRQFREKIESEGLLLKTIRSGKALYRTFTSMRVRWRLRNLDLHAMLSERLRCPACKDPGLLTRESDAFVCTNCSTRYPLIDGVPIFEPPQ